MTIKDKYKLSFDKKKEDGKYYSYAITLEIMTANESQIKSIKCT